MKSRIRAFSFLTALLLTLPAHAGPLEDATDAYYREDYQTALTIFKPLANAGNPVAQEKLATMYMEGLGVDRNCPAAMDWFLRAANQGMINSAHELGRAYDEGRCTKKDDIQAYMWDARAEAAYQRRKPLPNKIQADLMALAGAPKTTAQPDDIDHIQVDLTILDEVMTRDEVAEARHRAAAWKPVAEKPQ